MVFVVAVLAPEWIMAWALRQAIGAWDLARNLEKARLKAMQVQEGSYSRNFNSEEHAGHIARSDDGESSFDASTASPINATQIQLIKRHSNPSQFDVTCEKCDGWGSQNDLIAAAKRIGKADERTYRSFKAI